jgi:integrase
MTAPRMGLSHGGRYRAGYYVDQDGRARAFGLGAVAKVSESEARKRFASELFLLGGSPRPSRRAGLSVEEWCQLYCERRSDLAEGSRELLAGTSKLLGLYFAGVRLSAVKPEHAVGYREWLSQRPGRAGKISGATVALHLRNAKAMFAAAVKEGEIRSNPCDGVKAARQPEAVPWHYVTMEEFERVLAVLPAEWRPLWALCRLGGARLGARGGESLGLQWKDVDFDRRTITFRDQKRNRTRIVPMQPRLYEILMETATRAAGTVQYSMALDPEAFVCDVSHSNLDRKAVGFIRAAGLAPWSKPFHSLRKSLETDWLAVHPLPLVCGWLGNSPAVALKHYHRSDTADALARVTKSKSYPQSAPPLGVVLDTRA